MAKLIMDYYSGQDLYSDGDVENRIMDFVKNGWDLSDLDEHVDSREYYAFLYHLSSIRENILSWYPLSTDCKILEVGSGCGALTGMLCQKAKWVTSVELSKHRAEINYFRNQNLSNLEIIVGNLNDIPAVAEYDYVVLNGVLEYACSFTQGNSPFQTFLTNFLRYLKPKGKLLIAIENRLGIKYFAGAQEDHTDRCFWGIKKYPNDNTVKTFSKYELQELLNQSGYKYQRFYYPYPDYKFPAEIYSDENINSGNYGSDNIYFGKTHRCLFNEKIVIDSLKNEKVMDKFANSFLVEASVSKLNTEHVIYAKLNSARKQTFAIGTIIQKTKMGRKKVIKYPLSECANSHIRQTYDNSNRELFQNIYNLKGKLNGNSIEYPFIYSKTLSTIINDLCRDEKINDIIDLIIEVTEKLLEKGAKKRDIYTDRFKELFGDNQLEQSFECLWNPNIDIIFDNIFKCSRGYCIVDCEWYVDVWVPRKFIIWRMINELFAQNPRMAQLIDFYALLAKLQISKDEDNCFRLWANHFADSYVTERKLNKYQEVRNEIDISDIMKNVIRLNTNIYIDTGTGFNEEQKLCNEISISKDGFFEVQFDLSDWKNIHSLRWDPLDGESVKCESLRIWADGNNVNFNSSNGEYYNKDLFMNLDSQYILDISAPCDKLKIAGIMKRLSIPDNLLTVYKSDILPFISHK